MTNRLKIEVPHDAKPRFHQINGKMSMLVQFHFARIDSEPDHVALVQIEDKLWTVPVDWCRVIQPPQQETPSAAPSE